MYDAKFTSSEPNKSAFKVPKNLKKIVLPIVIILALVIILSATLYEIPAGNIGVVLRFGAVDRVVYPGINVKIPFVETVQTMNIRTQKDEIQATAMSENLQLVTSVIAVNYHLDGSKAKEVYQNIGANYAEIIVAPAIQNTFKAVTAKFDAEELITKRDEVRLAAEKDLTSQLARYNIIVENFNIVNFDFSDEYQNAIEAKQVAQQQVETAKQKLAQAEIEAQTEVARAQGQADAQKALNQTGALTPEYLQYLFLTKWSGVLPQVMTSSTDTVFDVSKFMTTQPEP
ncbi:MAG: prohibitin family protein [Anaerolineaceae bacterium]|nr:prohibitin family protein [Anaerolineaceae bacterium]